MQSDARKRMHADFRSIVGDDRTARLTIASAIVGRKIDTTNDLSENEVSMVLQALEGYQPRERTDDVTGKQPSMDVLRETDAFQQLVDTMFRAYIDGMASGAATAMKAYTEAPEEACVEMAGRMTNALAEDPATKAFIRERLSAMVLGQEIDAEGMKGARFDKATGTVTPVSKS